MNWIIEGARRWLESGLTTPAEVTEATAKYRDEQDAIGQFIDDICDVDGRLEIGALMLYKSYCDWCDSRRERPLYTADFKIALNRRGFESKRKGGGIIWMGIDLRNDFIEEKSDGSYGVILGR
jgi:putative DNA primase/helicase